MRGATMQRTLRAGAILATIAAGVLVGPAPAYAAPCSTVSHFKPQIDLPVGEGIDSPGITNAAAYEGVMDFGDGTTIPISLNQPFSHRFREPGTYTVTSTGRGLAFTSDGGSTPCEESGFVLTTVTVYPLEARITIAGGGTDEGRASYTFDGSGSVPSGEITDYSWDFGDGSYGEGASADHTYTTPGSFTVTLMILDTNGYAASASETVTSGEVVPLDVSGAPARPELDPDEFVKLGSLAGESSEGASWLLLALVLLGGVLAAGAGFLLWRSRPPSPSFSEGRPVEPEPTPDRAASSDAPAEPEIETVGGSGISYAQQRKRTTAVKGAGGLADYYGNMGEEVTDSVQKQHEIDAKRREELIEHYRTYQGASQEEAELYADRDLASYGNNLGMVPDIAKDVLFDAPIETVKEKWKWLGDLWNKTFPPKP